MPDIIANLRVDQAWGFVGISAALHDASGAYYNSAALNNVNNGHPEDKYGWALAGGAKFNLHGGDMIGFNVCYSEGAPASAPTTDVFQLYNNSTSVGLGWIADGVFTTGTQIELTKVWSALAGYEHIWNPKWRTSVFGGYVNVDYSGAATNCILQHTPGALAACGVARGWRDHLGDHSARRATAAAPTTSFWEAGTRTQWNPVPQLDIGLEVLYSRTQYRLQRPGDRAGERLASRRHQRGHRRPERLVRDVPLAAQLLSMIA